MRAREVFGERENLGVAVRAVRRNDLDLGDAFGESERGLQRVGQTTFDTGPPHESVDHHLDGVVLVPGQAVSARAQLDQLTVDARPGEPLLRELLEHAVVLALAASHHRRQHLEPRALFELQHPVDDLLRRLPRDHPTAVRAVWDPDARRRATGGSRRSR